MTESEKDAFKVAFVIYVISTLLCPGSKYDYVSIDYWNALVNPSCIKNYDWCEYVIQKLFQAVVKLKCELNSSNKVNNITGCYIFLQVLYLDSIDIGVLNMDHSSLPRIRHFSDETMKSMVLADSLRGANSTNDFEFGKSQLRDGSSLCYSWACDSFNAGAARIGSSMPALWEVACSFSRELGVEFKAVGPLFFAIAEFDRLNNAGQGCQAASVASVLSAIMEPYVGGFCYNAGRDLDFCWLGSDVSKLLNEAALFVCSNWKRRSCVMNSCSGSIADVPHKSGIELCRCPKKARLYSNSELGSCSEDVEVEGWNVSSKSRIYKLGSQFGGDDHGGFDYSFKHSMAIRAFSRYYISLCCMDIRNCLCMRRKICANPRSSDSSVNDVNIYSAPCGRFECPVILHCIPTHIEVSVESFTSQLHGQSEISMDMFDACIRRYKEVGDLGFQSTVGSRRRHIFESVFLCSVLAGTFDVRGSLIRDQLAGSHIGYKLSSCRMLLFPGLIRNRWVCYAWCLETNEISVFDPICHDGNLEQLAPIHRHVVQLVKNAIEIGASQICSGWQHDWGAASLQIIACPLSVTNRINRSGYAAAQLCFHFDGCVSSIHHAYDNSPELLRSLLKDALKLNDNYGTIPEGCA